MSAVPSVFCLSCIGQCSPLQQSLQQSPPIEQWPSLQQFSIPQQESLESAAVATSPFCFLQQSVLQHDALAFEASRLALIAYAPAVKPSTNNATIKTINFLFIGISPKYKDTQ